METLTMAAARTRTVHRSRSCGRRLAAVCSVVLLGVPLVAAQPTQQAGREPRAVPTIWLVGQSNAEGATAGEWLVNPNNPGNIYSHLASQPSVQIWWPGPSTLRPTSSAGWESYRVGSGLGIDNGSHWIVEGVYGPEASIGDAAQRHFGGVFVFKFTSVAFLDPRATPTWSPRELDVTVFDALFYEWSRAVAALGAQNLVPEVRGVMFVQGESDCFAPGQPDNLLYARAYAANLINFIRDVRTRLANPSLPFVIAQLHDRHTPREQWRQGEALVRSAQALVTSQDPRAALTDTDAFGVYTDRSMHFDAVGSLLFGYAMFTDLLPLLR